jgi:hypothetical protein
MIDPAKLERLYGREVRVVHVGGQTAVVIAGPTANGGQK